MQVDHKELANLDLRQTAVGVIFPVTANAANRSVPVSKDAAKRPFCRRVCGQNQGGARPIALRGAETFGPRMSLVARRLNRHVGMKGELRAICRPRESKLVAA